MERFWSNNARQNNYIPTGSEPFSAFPTIVNSKQMQVWCRSCHKWEPIIAFSNNVLKANCGKLYAGHLHKTIVKKVFQIRAAPY